MSKKNSNNNHIHRKFFQKKHFPAFSIVFQIKILNINRIKTCIHSIETEGGSQDF